MKGIRLDKFLADCGLGTRSEVKSFIKSKRVKVNGKTSLSPADKLDPDTDSVAVDDKEIIYKAHEYYMLNKPSGYVSATVDDTHKTVVDLIKSSGKGLFPVGRLDIDTEGLLIITNDGELAHNLLSPRKHVDKTYYYETDKDVEEELICDFARGLDIGEDKDTLPATLTINDNRRSGFVTIREGKFHQVKRMFMVYNLKVTYLKRMSMGGVTLDEGLSPGEYRELTKEELDRLRGLC
ncbi:MAG: rRNA pseudouridine synthase [Lachnospiraceae bacterium]|jgi:16S rRNA pseudouridine516 synthase|nr:rRNA pseudouridine synthase [Lachnospiraceae bacterium]